MVKRHREHRSMTKGERDSKKNHGKNVIPLATVDKHGNQVDIYKKKNKHLHICLITVHVISL